MKKKKSIKVPKNLKENTHLVLPMVVKKEYNLSELSENLKLRGYKYADEILMKYLTSYYFRRRLEGYLEVMEDHTDPEYFIELYTYP